MFLSNQCLHFEGCVGHISDYVQSLEFHLIPRRVLKLPIQNPAPAVFLRLHSCDWLVYKKPRLVSMQLKCPPILQAYNLSLLFLYQMKHSQPDWSNPSIHPTLSLFLSFDSFYQQLILFLMARFQIAWSVHANPNHWVARTKVLHLIRLWLNLRCLNPFRHHILWWPRSWINRADLKLYWDSRQSCLWFDQRFESHRLKIHTH